VTAVLARLRGVERRFGSVRALAGADLEVSSGEVHAVLGENGAGKTTLLGVLGGMLRPDRGTVEIAGSSVELGSPRRAWELGVGLVHQHFTLVPALSVLENLALGRDLGASGLRLRTPEVRDRVVALMDRTGLSVPLDSTVDGLGVGDRQRVEILKALLRDPPILVLDEPTAVLAPAEVESLFVLLRSWAEQGRAVVLVAHKIDEVLSVADRVTVLRRGRTVLTAARADVDSAALIRAMVGADAQGGDIQRAATGDGVRLRERPAGAQVARLTGVGVRRTSGAKALDGVALDVRRGEVVGVAGVEGNGQRELALVLSGRLMPDAGVAELPSGSGFIPQDRTAEGVIADFDLVENVALGLHDDARFGAGMVLPWEAMRHEAESIVSRFGVVSAGVESRAGSLSGGNQQRLVVGRELLRATDLLVAENPTRGLDVGATAFVHAEIDRLAGQDGGPGIVLISTDLDEILELSTRVLVMSGGRLLEVPGDRPTREEVGALMLSGWRRDA